MRIDALRLVAYGPFTDVVLDLSGGREGLHVIYGLNEAGKTSALRALRHMLYGIPERSPDNFIHPYAKMRIGIKLRNRAGDVFEFTRRKGRGHTLRAADDAAVVEEAALRKLLGGVEADFFRTMFGLGYDDLVRGGRDMVQGGGDSGQLAFSAGSGVVNLMETLNGLEAQADALFRPSGQKPKINAALGRLSRNRKALRQTQLSGQEWGRHDAALQAALKKKSAVDEELAALQKKLNRLRRISEALPLIAERRELISEWEIYGRAVLLPEDFAETRQELLVEIGVAETARERALGHIATCEKAIAGLDVATDILNAEMQIEEVYRELGSRHKAARDRLALETRRNTLRAEAAVILRSLREDLTLEQAEKLRIHKNEAVRIQELGVHYARLITRIEEARENLPSLLQEIAGIDRDIDALAAAPAVEDLRKTLSEAVEFGPLERLNREEQTEIKTAEKGIELERRRLGLERQKVDQLEGLPSPSADAILAFETRFGDLARRLDNLKADIAETRSRLCETERQIAAQQLERDVPTEEDLRITREKRDLGWRYIRQTLTASALADREVRTYIDATPEADNLIDAFEVNLQQADSVSDRLRREADRVAAKARLSADRTAGQSRLAQLEEDRILRENEKRDLETEWTFAWQPTGVQPRSAQEMGTWLRSFHALIDRVREVRGRKAKAGALKTDIDARRSKLLADLRALGGPAVGSDDSLNALIRQAQKAVQDADDISRRREQLSRDRAGQEKKLAAARLRLENSENELRGWQQQWEAAVRPIGLTAGALPAEATAVMEDIRRLFDTLREAAILQKRIDGIDRDADAFVAAVVRLAGALAPDLAAKAPDEAALELHIRLNRSREARSKQETLQKQVAQERRRLDQAHATINQVETRLKSMSEMAGVHGADELPEAERRSNRRRRIESDLKRTDSRLHQLSAGATIEDFTDEVMAVDPDAIESDIDRLVSRIEDRESTRSELDQTIGSERTELSKMDGSARAAELAEEYQVELGGLQSDVVRYARLKIAARVLAMAVERYREKNQGHLLKKASAFFNRITDGSFSGIKAEFIDSGRPVVVGVRSGGGDIVTVDAMSDGTADQLYLALRLAGLEDHLSRKAPLPLIVDDILIMFDDDRAGATLQILAELSRQTQVIFFTHHRHLVALAQKIVDASELFLHEIQRQGASQR